jgi:UDP-N-acetylglucosamine 2-epimerase (non-hydrolysing)
MLVNIEKILLEDRPEILLVCGDANTNLAGALAARKIHVKVGHVESGLRSYDWRMPEEHNRIIIDHISEYLFAPTLEAKHKLIEDGVRGAIFVVGNTIADATLKHSKKASDIKQKYVHGITKGKPYMLLTLHREENVDNEEILRSILRAIDEICLTEDMKVIFPVHPRTKKRFEEFRMSEWVLSIKHLKIIEPLGYLEFLAFLKSARLVMSDSGGIQEEACIINTPCITLRDNTERPETVKVGANRIAGTTAEGVIRCFREIKNENFQIPENVNPFGDGQTSRRIVETCLFGHPKDELI